jgi:putative dehydrogenase
MQTPAIGLIGLGLMGKAIASRLLGAGFAVLGFDIDADKRVQFGQRGGSSVDSIVTIAQRCPIVVLAVFSTDQVEQVIEGDGGLIGATTRIAICTSTCDPDRAQRLAARASTRGLALLEVPVSGTSVQVERGEAVGLIAGDAAAAAEAEAVISAICPRSYHLGPAGNGGRAKLAINLILGLNRAAIAEGVALAERLGLERERFLEVAKGSAAYSQVMDVKGTLWVRDRFEPPMSRVDQSLKDFRLMLEMGARVGMELPLATLYADLMEDCVAHGEASQDNAIIINAIRRRARPR